MNRLFGKYRQDLLILSTAIGLIGSIAAPWLEFRGVFQSWRIDEWHTFWRGDSSFLLGDVVAPEYPVPVEYAQPRLSELVLAGRLAGAPVALWNLGAAVVLAYAWIRPRRLNRMTISAALLKLSAFAFILIIFLLILTWALTSPSNLSLKVDFRTPEDLHSTTLVWSDVAALPVGPCLASAASLCQIALLFDWFRHRGSNKHAFKVIQET